MPCPGTRQANLPACSPQPSLNAERQAGKLWIPFLKVFWYDSTRGSNLESTDCKVDAVTTTPSRRLLRAIHVILKFHFASMLYTMHFQDRRSVLVALRLQRNRLFFDFVTPTTASKISSSFKNDALSDGTWHTVVVTVSSNYITFTLDCGLPQKR